MRAMDSDSKVLFVFLEVLDFGFSVIVDGALVQRNAGKAGEGRAAMPYPIVDV